jgi:hypothetical protein
MSLTKRQHHIVQYTRYVKVKAIIHCHSSAPLDQNAKKGILQPNQTNATKKEEKEKVVK